MKSLQSIRVTTDIFSQMTQQAFERKHPLYSDNYNNGYIHTKSHIQVPQFLHIFWSQHLSSAFKEHSQAVQAH